MADIVKRRSSVCAPPGYGVTRGGVKARRKRFGCEERRLIVSGARPVRDVRLIQGRIQAGVESRPASSIHLTSCDKIQIDCL